MGRDESGVAVVVVAGGFVGNVGGGFTGRSTRNLPVNIPNLQVWDTELVPGRRKGGRRGEPPAIFMLCPLLVHLSVMRGLCCQWGMMIQKLPPSRRLGV